MITLPIFLPVKTLASPMRGARILFVYRAADSTEVERCDNAWEKLGKTGK